MDQAQSALTALHSLRKHVRIVFETLADGIRPECNEEGENIQLHGIQELLNTTNGNLREIESAISNLQPLPGPLALGNSSHLSQEVSQDRQALYVQLVNSHKWIDKVHEYGHLGSSLLHTNSLKRSYTSSSTKRRRAVVNCHPILPQNFDAVLASIERTISGGLNYKITRPHASKAIVHITIDKVLKAVLLFKGFIIEWVTVKGYDEEFNEDLWAESKYMLFRKIQDHTHSAMLHFYSPISPEFAVRYFLIWFHGYSKLFKEPCKGCNKWLLNNFPATWRDFRTLESYHEECSRQ